MRIAIAAALTALIVPANGPVSQAAPADPYPWCAVYGLGDEGGSSNCYFMTLEQCRAAISGAGGFCSRNTFYNPKPSVPDEPVRRSRDRTAR